MYQIDEKLMASNRALVSIAESTQTIEPNLKSGMMVYDMLLEDMYVKVRDDKYSRFLQINAHTGKVNYDLNFAGNVTIDKNLTVLGEVTNVSTSDLTISDNIIELNKDETGDGISKISSGVEINRGTRPKASIEFTEITDVINMPGFFVKSGGVPLLTIYEDGNLKTLKNIDTKALKVNESARIVKDLTVSGNTDITGTLSMTGATKLLSTLEVSGATALKGTLSVDGIATLKNVSNFLSSVNISGKATISNDADITGNALIRKMLDVTLDINAARNISAIGNITGNNIEASGNLLVDLDATISRNLLTSGTMTTNGIATFNNSVNIIGATGTTSIVNSGNIKSATINTTGALTVGGAATITGLTSLNGALNIAGTMQTNSAVTMASSLNVAGLSTLNSLIVTDATSLQKTLTVGGVATVNGNLLAKSELIVTGKAKMNADLEVVGNIIGSTVSMNGVANLSTLNVSGLTTLTGQLETKTATVSKDILFNRSFEDGLKWRVPGNAVNASIFVGASNTVLNGVNAYNIQYKTTLAAEGHLFTAGDLPVMLIGSQKVRSVNNVEVKRGETWSPLLAASDQHKANHSIGGHDAISPANIGAVKNSGDVPEILSGLESNKPAAGIVGRLYVATDSKILLRDSGSQWLKIGGQDFVDWSKLTNVPATFTPPIATASQMGGVKIGSGIKVTGDGTISVPPPIVELAIRTQNVITTDGTVDYTINGGYILGINAISIYAYGRRLSSSAFTEKNNTTITLIEAMPAGILLDIYVMDFVNDVSSNIIIEEFIARAGQSTYTVSLGKFKVGENKVKIYINGRLMSKSGFNETSNNSISLLENPEAESLIMIEYVSDPYLS